MCNVSMCLCLHQHPAQKPVAPRSAWRSNNNLKCIFCIQTNARACGIKKLDIIYYYLCILKMLNRLSVRLNNEQNGEKGKLYYQSLNIINSEIHFYSHFKKGHFYIFSLIFQNIKQNSSPLPKQPVRPV